MSLIVKPIIARRKGYLANERKQSLARHINSISQISIEPVAKQARMNGASVGVNPFKRKYDDPFQAMAAATPLDQDQGLFSRQNINKILDKGEEGVKKLVNNVVENAKETGSKVASAFTKFVKGVVPEQIVEEDRKLSEQTEQPKQIVEDRKLSEQTEQPEQPPPPVIPVPLLPSGANEFHHDPATGLTRSNIPNKALTPVPLSEKAVQAIQNVASLYMQPKETSSVAQESTNSVDTSLSVNPSVEAEDDLRTWVVKNREKRIAEIAEAEAAKASKTEEEFDLNKWLAMEKGRDTRNKRQEAKKLREQGEQEVAEYFPEYYEQATELKPFEQAELMKKEAKDRDRYESRRLISESALASLKQQILRERFMHPNDKFTMIDLSPENVTEGTYQQIVDGIDFQHLRNKTSSSEPPDDSEYIRFLDTVRRQVYVAPRSDFDFETLLRLPYFNRCYKAKKIRFF